jgi:hypothetical protein
MEESEGKKNKDRLNDKLVKIIDILHGEKEFICLLALVEMLYLNTLCQGKASSFAYPDEKEGYDSVIMQSLLAVLNDGTEILEASFEEFIRKVQESKQYYPKHADEVDQTISEFKHAMEKNGKATND